MNPVLIVDANSDSLDDLEQLLVSHGYVVNTAQHGAEALLTARNCPPCLIITDLLLPVMDGYSLLTDWRADDRLKNIPFVFYTAAIQDSNAGQQARNFGADAWIFKPAAPELFIASVQEVLTRTVHSEETPHLTEPRVLQPDSRADSIARLEQKTRQLELANRALVAEIAERERSAAQFTETNRLLRAVANGTPDAMFVKDRNGKYLLFNAAAARFVNREVAEVLGRDDTALFDADSARLIMEHDQRVMESNIAVTDEEELTTAGVTRTFLATKAPYRDASGNVVGLLGISRDITDRKRTEQSLRENEAKLSEAVRLARLGYWSRDVATGVVTWSGTLYEIFGMENTSANQSLDNFLARVHPDDRSRVVQCLTHAEAELASFEQTYRIILNGEERVLHEIGQIVRSADGRATRVFGTARDVTELSRAQDALRIRDRAIQAVSQGILITDPRQPDNPIVYASDGFSRITGYTADEVIGKNCRFLQGAETDPETIAKLRRAISSAAPCRVEILNYRKDGGRFWNALSVNPVFQDQAEPTYYVGVLSDITEHKSIEEQFRQVQKMEAVGLLAGGVAHDFNNLLMVINGYSEMVIQNLPETDPNRELVAEIYKAGVRSAELTRQLLAFSRRQVLAPRIIDLNKVVREMDKLLRRLIGEDIQLVAELDPELWVVHADPGQIEQVLMNLAVNARDAMRDGGQLTIETGNINLDTVYTERYPDARTGSHVVLSVTDTGIGMIPEVQAKIFEPFFTTKPPGEGTGLGLSTVHGIIKQSGGHVTVHSEVGVGTSFKVYLPRVEPIVELPANRLEHQRVPGGSETILLVEDDSAIRSLTRSMLTNIGYTVLEAADGDDALRVAAGDTQPIHLLITDVVMPRSGGQIVAEQFDRIYPKVKVLFVSGYTNDAIVRRGILEDKIQFLAKPFSSMTLALKVRSILDQTDPANQ